jgi:hypothetical protein
MKILALLLGLSLVGCEEYVVPPNVGVSHNVQVGAVNVCDDTNACTEVSTQYYYQG